MGISASKTAKIGSSNNNKLSNNAAEWGNNIK
jgi:hypothetical protein